MSATIPATTKVTINQVNTTASANMDSNLFGHDSDWWSGAMLLSLLLAFVVAGLVAAATAGVIFVQKRESVVSGQKIAEANARALEAQLALERYRAGRSITPEQRQLMTQWLEHSPKGPVIIKPNFLSPEPTRYANALSEVFNQSGFSNVGDKPLSVVNTNLPGIFVVIRDRDHPPTQLVSIANALHAANISFSAHAEEYVPDVNTVVILVGEQP
ncbi:MAG: hypothetical protein ABSC92_07335 [Rhizomicrobium sp.]